MNSFNPLVSIIIPVYNGSNYMSEAIDSALAQTYKNIEIIVVNDGSKDNTESIALSYGNKIRYFSKENGGVATALNMAIENSNGEYISWLSHDDLFVADKIEYQVNYIANHPQTKFIHGDYKILDDNYNIISKASSHQCESTHKNLQLIRAFINGCSTLIEKSILEQVGKFDVNKETSQDNACFYEIFKITTPVYINKVFSYKRLHKQQQQKLNPRHSYEPDELFTRILSEWTDEQCLEMSSSVYSFYKLTAEHYSKEEIFKNTYKNASKLADIYFKKLDTQVIETKVSVVVTFHDKVDKVVRSLESVLEQTHKNIEIVLVDYGSKEDIILLKTLILEHKNIKLLNINNKNKNYARNEGIKNSSGEYIAFLESGDIFYSAKIEEQLYEMFKSGCFVSSTTCLEFLDFNLKRQIPASDINISTVIVNKNILLENLFPLNIDGGEDSIVWMEISKNYRWLSFYKVLAEVNYTYNVEHLLKFKKSLINIFDYLLDDCEYEEYHKLNQALLYSKIVNVCIADDNEGNYDMKHNWLPSMFGIFNSKNRLIIVLFFIKITFKMDEKKINKLAWWIPVQKWRDKFREKFN